MKHINTLNLANKPIQFSNSESKDNSWSIFHAHQGMEFLYIKEGSGSVIYEQRIFPLKAGSILYFQPFQLHGTKVELGSSAKYIRSMLLIEPTFMERHLTTLPNLKDFFNYLWKGKLQEQMIIDLDEVCYIESLFEQYNKIFTKYSYKNQEEALITLILTFLQYLKAIWPEEVWGKQKKVLDKEKNSAGDKEKNSAMLLGERATNNAEKIMEWIEEHYWTKFELDQLSKELHMSPYHISHLFKQAIGTSITEYLNARRMRQACWLLKSSDAPIEYIGQQVGLANFSYFCQLFKKITGVTPHKYRSSIF